MVASSSEMLLGKRKSMGETCGVSFPAFCCERDNVKASEQTRTMAKAENIVGGGPGLKGVNSFACSTAVLSKAEPTKRSTRIILCCRNCTTGDLGSNFRSIQMCSIEKIIVNRHQNVFRVAKALLERQSEVFK